VHFDAGRGLWVIDKAQLWEAIAKERRLDLTETYFDVAPELAAHRAMSRLHVIHAGVPYPLLREQHLPSGDRLLVSLAGVAEHLHVNSVLSYIVDGLESAGANPESTAGLRDAADFIYTASRVNPLASAVALDAWAARLAAEGQRGTYYYFHAILPHFPYLFTSRCDIRRVREWRGRAQWLGHNTLQSREERYRLYAQQVLCTQQRIASVLSAVAANPRLKDAVVIVHGDHGARIGFRDDELERWLRLGRTVGEFERDWRAAAFAVRMPNLPAGRVKEPAAIHDLLAHIAARGFADLDSAALPIRDDPVRGR
jgi:hypothetical protein